MNANPDAIGTPALLVDATRLEGNLARMQAGCDAAGTELWPHVKTHKMIPVLRRQLELGAGGATCAKIGEAEALLPAGVRRVFLAHSLGDLRNADRLRSLASSLDQLILAVTSPAHFPIVEALLVRAGLRVPVLMAVDTGLGREGVREPEAAAALAERIRGSDRMELIGIYTHEGHAYGSAPGEVAENVSVVHARLQEFRDAIGGELPMWPGCSVTAALMAAQPGVHAVRPGTYVFGDLFLIEKTGVMSPGDAALTVLATVVDRPAPDLALIDAGSKVFSGDKTAEKWSGRCMEFPSLLVTRVSEEHGFVTGDGVDQLRIGDRLRFVPAHVCPVVNLAERVHVIEDGRWTDTWTVDARGRSD